MQQAQGHTADRVDLAGIGDEGLLMLHSLVASRTATRGIKLVRRGAQRPEHSCN